MAAGNGLWITEEVATNDLDSQKSLWHKLWEKRMDGR